jgi:small-conductance mechanosensitive channel
MPSSGMSNSVAPVRTNVSEECSVSIIRVTRIVFFHSMRWLLISANVVPSSPILVTLMMERLCSSERSFLTRVTRRNIPEDGILLMVISVLQNVAFFFTRAEVCAYLRSTILAASLPYTTFLSVLKFTKPVTE